MHGRREEAGVCSESGRGQIVVVVATGGLCFGGIVYFDGAGLQIGDYPLLDGRLFYTVIVGI